LRLVVVLLAVAAASAEHLIEETELSGDGACQGQEHEGE
jgi:hypothetical protein